MALAPYPDPNLDKQRGLAKLKFGLDTANFNWQKNNLNQQQATDTSALAQQYAQQREALPGQWAGRGLLNSGIAQQGLYNFNQQKVNAFAKLQQQYGQQQHNVDYGQANAGYTQAASLADVDAQEAQARASLAAQLRGIV